jgi:hypothetical protein
MDEGKAELIRFDGPDDADLRSGVGAFRQVPGAEMALNTAAPSLDEGIVESAADGGTREGNQPANPLFGTLLTDADGNLPGEARGEFLHHLFLDEVFAEVDAGGCSGGHPEFQALIFVLFLESVQQAKPLNQAESDDGEQAGIRNQGNHATESEAGTLSEGKALRVVHQASGDGVELFDRNIFHAPEMRHPEAVLFREVFAEVFGVDFDGAEPAKHAETHEATDGATCERLG